jgi:hypothetical protein
MTAATTSPVHPWTETWFAHHATDCARSISFDASPDPTRCTSATTPATAPSLFRFNGDPNHADWDAGTPVSGHIFIISASDDASLIWINQTLVADGVEVFASTRTHPETSTGDSIYRMPFSGTTAAPIAAGAHLEWIIGIDSMVLTGVVTDAAGQTSFVLGHQQR